MTRFLKYKAQIATCDADDDIESWITVRGNHIPIKKGQSKEEAVKAFVESKFNKGDWKLKNSKTGETYKTGKSGHLEKESKYDPEFEVVRKNALANGNVYGGKYTQKSKAEAYKEYKNDTASKENMKEANKFVNGSGNTQKPKAEEHTTTRTILTMFHKHYDDLYDGKTKHNASLVKEFDDKMAKDPEFKKQVQAFVRERGDILSSDREVEAYMLAYNTTKNKLEPANKKLSDFHEKANKTKSDSTLVNAVAKSLGKTPEEAEKEINGAVQYIKDLIKSKDLRNGDVEETLQGLGVEPDYAEEFMQWVSHPAKKKTAPKVTHVDKKAWNSPASDPWKSLYDSDDTKKRWSADWKKRK